VTTSTTAVDGVPATVLTSRDGTLAAVLWVDDGIITAVAGSLREEEVLDVARQLR
jgi:anti-sigma factor RsiW